jgi:hypothetical protein
MSLTTHRDQIVGTYDLQKKVEDTVILLDLTQTNYGDPQRAIVIEESIQEMVLAKTRLSASHRYALVGFGETVETYLDFDNWSGPESLMDVLYNKIKIHGVQAYFQLALQRAFETAAKSMQKLSEGKVFRILVISEGRFAPEKKDWAELVDVAAKIGLFIDAVKLGLNEDPTLKRATRATSGDYVECKIQELKSWLPSFAAEKKQQNVNQTEADKNMKGLLELIASPLKSIRDQVTSPNDLLKLVQSTDATAKCGICYSDTCMICKGPSYACGSYCPNCNRFFHIHCAAAWAENSKDTPNNVFKCPVCFSLCKVPGELYRIKVLKGRLKDSFLPSNQKLDTKKIQASDLGTNWMYETCVVCGGIFENQGDDVLVCSAPDCGALYHPQCLDKNEQVHDGRCRKCDILLRRKFDANKGVMRIV